MCSIPEITEKINRTKNGAIYFWHSQWVMLRHLAKFCDTKSAYLRLPFCCGSNPCLMCSIPGITRKNKSHQKRCDIFFGTPNGNRTHVAGMRIRCPGPLDDGSFQTALDPNTIYKLYQKVKLFAGVFCVLPDYF